MREPRGDAAAATERRVGRGHDHRDRPRAERVVDAQRDELAVGRRRSARGAKRMSLMDVPAPKLGVPMVTAEHFASALRSVRPTVSADDLAQHLTFSKEFGSG